jgi:putative DNA primase/helicase
MTPRPDAPEVSRLLSERMEDLARDLAGEPTHRGREEWRFRSRGSLAVVVAGLKRGDWYDHEAGEGGDALALVAHLHRKPMGAAYAWALAWLGLAAGGEPRSAPQPRQRPPETPRGASAAEREAKALLLWHEATSAIDESPAALHLSRRGIDPARLPPHTGTAWPAALRWHAASGSMLVAVNDAQHGMVRAVQAIALHPDGSPRRRGDGSKIKLTYGPASGRAARFGWHPDPQGRWGIAEGAASALAAAQQLGHPVWAALGAGNVPNIMPPAWARSATIVADHDDAGMRGATEAASRIWQHLAVRIIRATKPGADAADLLEASA